MRMFFSPPFLSFSLHYVLRGLQMFRLHILFPLPIGQRAEVKHRDTALMSFVSLLLITSPAPFSASSSQGHYWWQSSANRDCSLIIFFFLFFSFRLLKVVVRAETIHYRFRKSTTPPPPPPQALSFLCPSCSLGVGVAVTELWQSSAKRDDSLIPPHTHTHTQIVEKLLSEFKLYITEWEKPPDILFWGRLSVMCCWWGLVWCRCLSRCCGLGLVHSDWAPWAMSFCSDRSVLADKSTAAQHH